MRTLSINFKNNPETKPLFTWLLIICCALVSIYTWYLLSSVLQRNDELSQQLIQLNHEIEMRQADIESKSENLSKAQRIRIARRNQLPWANVFSILEQTKPVHIAFLSVKPNSNNAYFQVEGEAKSVEHLLAFLNELNRRSVIRYALMSEHKLIQKGNKQLVKFVINVAWYEVGQ